MKRTQRNEFPGQQFGKDRQIGLIAKEVGQVAPEVVQQGSDGYLFVDYGRLTPLLIQAIQEQQREIAQKDQRIDDLETRLARVEKLLSKMSALRRDSHDEANDCNDGMPRRRDRVGNGPGGFCDRLVDG